MTKTERAERKAERQASKARMDAHHAETQQIWDSGSCPDCGQDLRRNLSLAGWIQCSGLGAEGFRAAGSTPCNWQGFTS